jgi:hypothetical protein
VAHHDFVVNAKRESGSGLTVQRCRRCGLEVWPGSLRKDFGNVRWEIECVPSQAEAAPFDPEWLPSEQKGWNRRER